MKRLMFVILTVALAVSLTHAGWWKIYEGTGDAEGHCVQETSDGNYIIAGRTGEWWDQLYLLKVDTLGDILWSHIYSGGLIENFWVEETSDGGYIVSCTPGLLKTNSQGDSLWMNDYGIISQCVQETNDGGYIVIGTYEDQGSLAMLKTNSQGDTLWTKNYKMEGWDFTNGGFVRETNDSGFIISGVVWDSNIIYTQSYPKRPSVLLIKTNSSGDTLWTRIPGIEGGGSCIRLTSDGGYIVTGCGLLKIDSLGNTTWWYDYPGVSVQQTSDKGYILTGAKDEDLFLLKTDSLGDSLWTRTYGGNELDFGKSVSQTSDGGYIITGHTESFGSGLTSLYLLKTDSLGLLGIMEKPTSESGRDWEVISPIGTQIILRYSDRAQGFTAHIYDGAGREVDKLCSSSSSGVFSWGKNYAPGVYFIAVSDINTMSTAKVVLTH